MVALTADRKTDKREGRLDDIPVAAVKVYAGSLVCINTAGYLAPAANTAGFRLAGVSAEYVDNAAGAAGAVRCRVMRDHWHRYAIGSVAITDIGKKLYVADDQTVTLTPGNVPAGVMAAYISATEVWLDIAPALEGTRERKKVSAPLPALTANSTVRAGLLCVQESCRIMAISIACHTIPVDADGTCTIAITNYDISGTPADDNLLSTATVDLEALVAKTTSDLTLTATVADLVLEDGDYVFASLVNNSAAIDTNMAGAVCTIEYEPMT